MGCLPGKPPNDNTYFRQPAARGDALERAGWSARECRAVVGAWVARRPAVGRVPERHLHQADVPRPREAGGGTRRPPCTRVRTPTGSSSWSTTTSTPPTRTRVLWALCTRTEVTDDIDVVKRMWSTSLDPMAYAGDEGPRYLQQPHDHRRVQRPFEAPRDVPAGGARDAGARRRAPLQLAAALHRRRQGPQGRAPGEPERGVGAGHPRKGFSARRAFNLGDTHTTDRDQSTHRETLSRTTCLTANNLLRCSLTYWLQLEGPCVLAVDAPWGNGKTTFLNMWGQVFA